MSTIIVTGTGSMAKVAPKPFPEQKPGKHLWIVVAGFQVNPENDQAHLDTENLLSINGPGCYWCEELYSPEEAAKPCRGEPERSGR